MNQEQAKEYVKGLREKIAEELYYLNFRPEARDKVISWETVSDITRGHFLKDATQLLTEVLGDLEIPIDGELPENPFKPKVTGSPMCQEHPQRDLLERITNYTQQDRLEAGYRQAVKVKDIIKS